MQECQLLTNKKYRSQVGQHAGIMTAQNRSNLKEVGQHAGISIAENRDILKKKMGQHAGMVGQHKQEWWVNMRRNLQCSALQINNE